ncbi:hypothetical protein MRX96_047041 [Rhipicephalus microplus]
MFLTDRRDRGSSCTVAMVCCGAPYSLVVGVGKTPPASWWGRKQHRDPSGDDSSLLVADGVATSLEFWLGEPAMLPRRGGRGVRAHFGDGGREHCGQLWSVSLFGDSCCLGLGGIEVALPSCEKSRT